MYKQYSIENYLFFMNFKIIFVIMLNLKSIILRGTAISGTANY